MKIIIEIKKISHNTQEQQAIFVYNYSLEVVLSVTHIAYTIHETRD